METKTCQNCKSEFIIDQDDFDFYAKINVPPPTFCPECRAIRRLTFRNERVWYRRNCDATGKQILSMFSPDTPYTVYEEKYWKSDAWDPMDYGKDYIESETFFDQLDNLFKKVPHPNLIQKNNVNCEYSNYTLNGKNCYYCASFDEVEDSAYCFTNNTRIKNCLDLHVTAESEYCYELIDSKKCSRVCFAQNCESCVNSIFLYDCRNCTDCFGCIGLRNKQYYIFNEQYDKETYKEKIKELWDGGYTKLKESLKKFNELKIKVPHKFANIVNSYNVSGDNIANARNCHFCYIAKENIENCKYCFRVWENTKDGWDAYCAWKGSELFYEAHSIIGQRIFFSLYVWGGHDVEYSYNCFDCNNIFGCVGLRNKSYCILNKQYSKEEYLKLIERIKENMRMAKEYGEFLPSSVSPFAYNETIAQDYFPLSKKEIIEKGYRFKEAEKKNYAISMNSNSIPENISTINESIVNEVLACEHNGTCSELCATAFKITKEELQFYRNLNLPLPRLCPSCRHFRRVNLKNPMKLWTRTCMCQNGNHGHERTCPQKFETPYAPERKELIYCEKCYQQEIL